MSSQVVLKLTGPMDHLRLTWQAGEALLESIPFDDDPEGTRYNILLALQEMVTNVLRHAYELDESKPIEVVFAIDETSFEIQLRDQGPEFDPLAHDTSDVAEDTGIPREIGGFGIHIAKIVMDELGYERVDGWNILRLRKLVAASVPSSR